MNNAIREPIEPRPLRVWTITLAIEANGWRRAVAYEIWARDEVEATRLALADVALRGETTRDALHVERGSEVRAPGAAAQVRVRASQRVRLHTV